MNLINKLDNILLLEYKKKTLITDLYQYYLNNGFNKILVDKSIKLLISYILLIILNIIANCVDYSILTLDDNIHELKDYININKIFPRNIYLIICFIIYCIYLLFLTVEYIKNIKKYWKIRKIYKHYLNINDTRLKFISWDEIVDKIIIRLKHFDILDINNIDIYTINNNICNQSNILIGLLNTMPELLPNYSSILEWNLIFCIIDPMTKSYTNIDTYNETDNIDNEINNYEHPYYNYNLNDINTSNKSTQLSSSSTNENILNNSDNTVNNIIMDDSTKIDLFVSNSIIKENKFDDILYSTFINQSYYNDQIVNYIDYINTVNYRIKLTLFIYIISMPFLIIIYIIYLIIKYGEKMYINPMLLLKETLDIKTKWQLRYYNELPHLFKERIHNIELNMEKIINLYYKPITQIIYRFIIFIVGSIFIFLLGLSFIANENYQKIDIIHNYNIIWFLSICATLLILLNKIIHTNNNTITKEDQLNAFNQLYEDLITIEPNLLNNFDKEYLYNIITNIYKSKLKYIFYEIYYIIITPYYLYLWHKIINQKYLTILNLIENHHQLGTVCKYSIFTNIDELKNNHHMLLSLKHFHLNHKWNNNIINITDIHSNSNFIKSFIHT